MGDNIYLLLMRAGDLVRFKARDLATEVGGHRDLDHKRYWWLAPSFCEADTNDVYLLIEKNPRLYGADCDGLERPAILMDASTKRFIVVSTKQIKTVNSAHRPKM